MKNTGKPCAGKPYARFDEGGAGEADDGKAIETPPDERGGNGYAMPNECEACSLLYLCAALFIALPE